MKVGFIRWIDKYIGSFICFLLTLYRKISGIFEKEDTGYQKLSKVLFIKLVEQGSTVLAWPALKKGQDLVGKSNIYFMVFKENRPILDILNAVPNSNIIEVDAKNLITFLVSVIKALAKIRREKIDAVVDMEFFSRASAMLSYLSGAGKRVGLHRFNCEAPYRGDLFTHKLIYNPYLHTRLFFVSLVEALKYSPSRDNSPMSFEIHEITNSLPSFNPTEKELKMLKEKIEKIKKSSLTKPIIILNPKIGDLLPSRKWPEDNFVILAKKIISEYPQSSIIITGDSREAKEDNALASRIEGAVSLAGLLSLEELFTLYCLSDVLITSDSGPAHFSTLTSIKSVIIFGPETPYLYGQVGPKVKMISPECVCSPCVNVYNARKSPCLSSRCVAKVSPEEVYEKLKSLL